MGKKILSLLLSLSMLMAITANCTLVSAETKGTVSVEYYEDAALQTKVQGNTVESGDIVYAAVKLGGLGGALAQGAMTFGYDPSLVKLVNYSASEDVVIPADGISGFSAAEAGAYGVEIFSIGSMELNSTKHLPKIEKVADRYAASAPVAGKETVLVSMQWANGDEGSIAVENTNLVAFKFEAVADGDAEFVFPRKINGVDGDYYAERNPYGTELNCVNNDYLTSDDLTFSVPVLKIKTNIPSLKAPTNVKVADGKITWDAVADADGYEVTVVSTNGIGAGTYIIEDKDINGTTADFPTKIKCGDISVTVKAISDTPAELQSSEASVAYTERMKMNLLPPTNVVWSTENSTEVVWDAVEGAVSYKVELTEGATPVTIVTDTVTATAYDFASYLKDPEAGETKIYNVKITAIGDGIYTLDDTTGAAAPTKKKLGTVKNATSAAWEDGTCKAVWEDDNDSNIVRGYSLTLKKDGHLVAEVETENEYYDFASYMTEAGVYEYTVRVLGATTQDGTYEDAVTAVNSSVKIVSEQLAPVTEITWRDRTIEWTDDTNVSCVYNVELWEGETLVYSSDEYVTEKSFDFDTVSPSPITIGTYTAKVQAIGDGSVYLNSEWAESEAREFTQRHTDPTNLVWDGQTAKWDADANATNGYTVALYFNGVALPGEEYSATTAEYDFADRMSLPGVYTFSVKKNGTTDYSASKVVVSTDEYEKTVVKTGDIYVELYDETGTAALTELKVGDVFYAIISMKGTEAFNVLGVPFKFDPTKVKVVGADNTAVVDGNVSGETLASGAMGITAGAILDDMTVIYDQTYVSNTDGLVVVQAYGDRAVSDAEKEEVIIIKMIANAYSSVATEFSFAAANDDEVPYEETLLAGYTFAMDDVPHFANITYPAPITIEQGTLATMAAPVWDGTEITWNKADSANVTGYTIELRKGENVIETIENISPDVDFYDLTELVKSKGSYTVRIKALGDTNAADSAWSDWSEAYVKSGGGGGGSLSNVPKDDEDDKKDDDKTPVTPDKPVMEFTDIAGHWAEESIKELSKYGVLAGYADGTFRPGFGITRAEFTKLMVSCLGYENYVVEEANVYEDTADHWAKDYISIATEIGIVSGIGDNLFAPDVIITREQVAAVIYRAAEVTEEIPVSGYTDREEVSEYAKTAVDYAAQNNIMIGFEDNTFRGTEDITRAQMAIVLLKLLQNGFFAEYSIN